MKCFQISLNPHITFDIFLNVFTVNFPKNDERMSVMEVMFSKFTGSLKNASYYSLLSNDVFPILSTVVKIKSVFRTS